MVPGSAQNWIAVKCKFNNPTSTKKMKIKNMTTLPLRKSYAAIAFFGLLWVLPSVNQTALAQRIPPTRPTEFVAPIVFQAAGTTLPRFKVRSTRSAPLWEIPTTATTRGRSQAVAARSTGTAGATTSATSPPVTPFNVFLDTRGAQFTTPGVGLSQAPPVADPIQFPPGGWPAFQQSDVRDHLQHLQSGAPVHSCGQQHYRRFVLHTGYHWH